MADISAGQITEIEVMTNVHVAVPYQNKRSVMGHMTGFDFRMLQNYLFSERSNRDLYGIHSVV
jgi:hypothetical protein